MAFYLLRSVVIGHCYMINSNVLQSTIETKRSREKTERNEIKREHRFRQKSLYNN